jgi:hypothetical protein
MFAIMFGDNQIVEINCRNQYEMRDYKKADTFDAAKAELIDYWDKMVQDAKRNMKDAKRMKVPYSYAP